jgi:hypothetical protein
VILTDCWNWSIEIGNRPLHLTVSDRFLNVISIALKIKMKMKMTNSAVHNILAWRCQLRTRNFSFRWCWSRSISLLCRRLIFLWRIYESGEWFQEFRCEWLQSPDLSFTDWSIPKPPRIPCSRVHTVTFSILLHIFLELFHISIFVLCFLTTLLFIMIYLCFLYVMSDLSNQIAVIHVITLSINWGQHEWPIGSWRQNRWKSIVDCDICWLKDVISQADDREMDGLFSAPDRAGRFETWNVTS